MARGPELRMGRAVDPLGAVADAVPEVPDVRPWRLALLLVLAAHLILALGYSLSTPLGEGPDEPGHIGYVQYLLAERRLPVHGQVPAVVEQQVKHPPLYYILGALATTWADYEDLQFLPNPQFSANLERPPVTTAQRHGEGETWPWAPRFLAVRVLRLVSVLLGLVLVWATWALARLVLGGQPDLALAAAALVAFLPQLLFMQGVSNNDALAVPLAALALWLAARVALGAGRRRDWSALGLVVGLALLSKLTTLAMLPVAVLALAIAAYRRRSWRLLGRSAVWTALPLAAVTAWWFGRNLVLAGDALGWQGFESAASVSIRQVPVLADLPQYIVIQRTSFLGRFGWMTVPLPDWAHEAFAGLVLVALAGLVGLVLWWWRRPAASANPLVDVDARWGLALSVGAVVLVYLSVFRLVLSFNLVVAQGRYLFTALPALAVLMALGLLGWWPRRWRPWGSLALVLAMAAFATYALVGVLRPAFALPPPVPVIPEAGLAQYAGHLVLEDVELPRRRLRPGEMVTATLTWKVLQQPGLGLRMFAQVVDSGGDLVGQVDRIPFDGRYPASSWLPGRRFAETVSVSVAPDATPGQARLLLGWFPEGRPDERLAVAAPEVPAPSTGAPVPGGPPPGAARPDGAYHLPLVIEGSTPVTIPLTATLRADTWPVAGGGAGPLAGNLALAAFAIHREPGGVLLLDLYWQVDVPIPDDYTVFIHLATTGQEPALTADGPPVAGRYETSQWLPGELILDRRRLVLTGLPAGAYGLGLGLYNGRTGRRRPALDAAGDAWPAGMVDLGEVVVGDGGAWVFRSGLGPSHP